MRVFARLSREGLQFLAAVIAASAAAVAAEEYLLDRSVPERATGPALQAELRRPFFASWKNVPLRTGLRRISDERKAAVLLDRRLDPGTLLDWSANGIRLQEALEDLAARVGSRAVLVGSTLLITPADAADRIRGLVELTGGQLTADTANVPRSRLADLAARRTIHWSDFDRPADVVRQIADRFRLEVEGLDRVPHDLWAGGTLPAANAREALHLVLVQYDLTFRWTEAAAGIEIVPAPDVVVVERSYTPRGTTAVAAASLWPREIPDLRAEARGGRVVVRGTIEQHDALQALLQPRTAPRTRVAGGGQPPPPLRRRRFTLQAEHLPASRLMETLADSGVVFEYDADRLTAAGIDLDRPVTIDANDADADGFFSMVFGQVGLDFEIDGLTVRLTPQ